MPPDHRDGILPGNGDEVGELVVEWLGVYSGTPLQGIGRTSTDNIVGFIQPLKQLGEQLGLLDNQIGSLRGEPVGAKSAAFQPLKQLVHFFSLAPKREESLR